MEERDIFGEIAEQTGLSDEQVNAVIAAWEAYRSKRTAELRATSPLHLMSNAILRKVVVD